MTFLRRTYPKKPRAPLVVPETPPVPRGVIRSAEGMAKPVPKLEIVRSQPYLAAVARLRCINCGWEGASQAAHPNSLEAGGSGGGKASDTLTFPLCCERGGAPNCHREFDQYRLVSKADMPEFERRWAALTQERLIAKSLEPGREARMLRNLLMKLGLVR